MTIFFPFYPPPPSLLSYINIVSNVIYNNSIFQFRFTTYRENLNLKHIPDLKCVPNLERVLENKNALTILTVLFKQFPFRSAPFFY